MQREEIWNFSTPQYDVTAYAVPEDDDPADHFEFPDDIEAIRDGNVAWFGVLVQVSKNGHVIGSDYLGRCAYASASEFVNGHRDADPMNRNCSLMRSVRGENVCVCHYFPDMVRQAIADARATLAH